MLPKRTWLRNMEYCWSDVLTTVWLGPADIEKHLPGRATWPTLLDELSSLRWYRADLARFACSLQCEVFQSTDRMLGHVSEGHLGSHREIDASQEADNRRCDPGREATAETGASWRPTTSRWHRSMSARTSAAPAPPERT